MKRLIPAAVLVSLIGPSLTQAQPPPFPLGTAFTYQGRLTAAGVSPTGDYDTKFTLYDSPSGGSVVGSGIVINAPPVPVSNGLFTVTLDFGAGIFTGSKRWLEIEVKPAGPGTYTTLSPRQELTPTPNAVYAASAASATTATTVAGLVCTNGQVVKWSGSEWTCGADLDTNSGGTVTSVGAGTGLLSSTTNPITSSGSISIDTAVVPRMASANTFTTTQTVSTGAAAAKGVIVRGAASQTANLLELQNSAGAVLSSFGPSGGFNGNVNGNATTATAIEGEEGGFTLSTGCFYIPGVQPDCSPCITNSCAILGGTAEASTNWMTIASYDLPPPGVYGDLELTAARSIVCETFFGGSVSIRVDLVAQLQTASPASPPDPTQYVNLGSVTVSHTGAVPGWTYLKVQPPATGRLNTRLEEARLQLGAAHAFYLLATVVTGPPLGAGCYFVRTPISLRFRKELINTDITPK